MVQRLNTRFDRALTLVGHRSCCSPVASPSAGAVPAHRRRRCRPPRRHARPAISGVRRSRRRNRSRKHRAPVQPLPQQPKPQSTVTLALQDEAQRAATAGDLPKAIQILERAIRIQPDSAELWLELARVHLKEGNAAQAEQFARKALLFTRQSLRPRTTGLGGHRRCAGGETLTPAASSRLPTAVSALP